MKTQVLIAIAVAMNIALTGCESMSARVLDEGDQTQLQKRSYQSRVFDSADKQSTMRTVISTLQDLGFIIDKADLTLGTVSATKFNGYQLKMTVSVRPRGTSQMLVRANVQFNIRPVEDPKPYQDFFVSLEKAMFLTAQAVE